MIHDLFEMGPLCWWSLLKKCRPPSPPKKSFVKVNPKKSRVNPLAVMIHSEQYMFSYLRSALSHQREGVSLSYETIERGAPPKIYASSGTTEPGAGGAAAPPPPHFSLISTNFEHSAPPLFDFCIWSLIFSSLSPPLFRVLRGPCSFYCFIRK